MKNKNIVDKVEENIFLEQEEQEYKKQTHFLKKHRKRRICPPSFMFDSPIYDELKYIIICNDKSKLCPRRWEELEIDINNLNRRFCKITNQYIYKVENLYNYNRAKEKNLSISMMINSPLLKQFDDETSLYIKKYLMIQKKRREIFNHGYYEEDDIFESDIKEL